MRIAPWICLLCYLAVGMTGCSSFGKKNNTPPAPGVGPGGNAPPKFPTNNDPILNSTSSSAPGQAIIAGQVVDEYGRPAPNAYVRVIAVTEKDTGSPLDIPVTAGGYFTVLGLKSGVDYKLIARTKMGEKMIAGQTQTSAPNVRGVLIKMSSDLVGATTPELPAHVGKEPSKTSSTLGTPEPLPTWKPGPDASAGIKSEGMPPKLSSIEPDMPSVKVPTPGPRSEGPTASIGSDTWPPPLSIGAGKPETKPIIPHVEPGTPTIPTPGKGTALGPARVPSCVLIGKQLINFALNDINGEPWEFRSNRQGKLVLLDFWGTGCIPCRETLPFLRELDLKYRSQGLEIIGLAYENAGSQQEQAYRVNAVIKGQNITYRQLLGAGSSCPVGKQFGVSYIPTLILLDENGWILWRHQNRPDRASLDELERWIQRRLPAKG